MADAADPAPAPIAPTAGRPQTVMAAPPSAPSTKWLADARTTAGTRKYRNSMLGRRCRIGQLADVFRAAPLKAGTRHLIYVTETAMALNTTARTLAVPGQVRVVKNERSPYDRWITPRGCLP